MDDIPGVQLASYLGQRDMMRIAGVPVLKAGSKTIILLLLVAQFASRALSAVPDVVLKELVPTGVLRAAINYNNPLLAKRDAATGELSGLAVDLSRELAARLGAPLALIPFDAAGRITGTADRNEWDIGFLAIDPRRRREIDFTAAEIELEGTYLVPASSPFKRAEDVDRPGVRIAVTSNSAYDLFLSRKLKFAKLVRAENTPKSIALMLRQKLDAVAGVRTALVKAKRHVPGSRVLSGHFMTIPQAVGVPKGRPAAARYVGAFVEEMKASGFVAAALRKQGFGPDDAIVAGPASRSDQ